MAQKKSGKKKPPTAPAEIPPGFKLRHTLRGHEGTINRITWSPNGRMLASPSDDTTICLWDAESGKLLRTLKRHSDSVYSVAWSPDGRILASGSYDKTICLWDTRTGEVLRIIKAHGGSVFTVAWSPDGRTLASGLVGGKIQLWDAVTGDELRTLRGHTSDVLTAVWSPDGRTLASASDDKTIRLWDTATGKILHTLKGQMNIVLTAVWSSDSRMLASGSVEDTIHLWDSETGRQANVLEGHTGGVTGLSFDSEGLLLASKSRDDTVRIWRCDTWETVATLREPCSHYIFAGLAFHPKLPVLATLGERDSVIRIWKLDYEVLLGVAPAVPSVHHTTAKIVLVGDSGVGKTGLGWRLAHGEFKDHPSSHGQQFWVLDSMKAKRKDGTECEAVLWDLAGQPDYRLIHALFLDDVELALVLFDPTERKDPLHVVDFWLKALSGPQDRLCQTILVGARTDRGDPTLTPEEIDAFCRNRTINGGYIGTSALEGDGLEELIKLMQDQIDWDNMTATTTTATFKRIKEYVLDLKEDHQRREALTDPAGLRERLEALDKDWEFTDDEMMTAVGHLAKYGYVQILRTASGAQSVLLAPDLLNNLAASFVVEARRNPKGLGALDEALVLSGGYDFRELDKLDPKERDILLDAAMVLFLEHNICFRESLGRTTYLIFPELINLKKPALADEIKTVDDVSYTISGSVENVYAALVVLLGYTSVFTRTDQWRNQAQYEVGDGEVCCFRQTEEREGEIDIVLYYGAETKQHNRQIYQGLFERILYSRNVTVSRYPPQVCPRCNYAQERAEVVRRTREKRGFMWCSECGKKIELPKAAEEIILSEEDRILVDQQQATAERRTEFEKAVVQVLAYLRTPKKKVEPPSCFISYAWGVSEHERWVEKQLAIDLKKAGVDVILDRWENAKIGSNVARFISQITECDLIIVVGTPLYREKYENKLSPTGSIVATEVDLINQRMIGTEKQKKTVLPVLLEGSEKQSLPPLMRGRVYADFRSEKIYFSTLFDLILSLYNIPVDHQAVIDLRDSLVDKGHAGNALPATR